jgi:hypothetical protein
MRKALLFILIGLSPCWVNAQCTPNPEYADEVFGVWPDTITNFASGVINEAYMQVIDFKVPLSAQQILPDLQIPVPIDSISLAGITGLPAGLVYLCASQTGAFCTFLGGAQGCGVIEGAPTEAGLFPVVVQTIIYVTLFGNIVPYAQPFEGYSITIEESSSVNAVEQGFAFKLLANSPNPAISETLLSFDYPLNERVHLQVHDLVGQLIIDRKFNAVQGKNQIRLNVETLESGIYIYSIHSSQGSQSRKMLVNR